MVTKSSRALWTSKLSYKQQNLSFSKKASSESLNFQRGYRGIVMGIDGSLRGTGVAIIEFSKSNPRLIFSKRITCPLKLTFYQCIHEIFKGITEIVNNHNIDCVAIEQTVYVQNCKISHILGASRGAIIAAVMGKDLPIFEYEPLRIKQSITGFGRATKEQIKRTVCGILNIPLDISYDEGDAAATAICHAWTLKNK